MMLSKSTIRHHRTLVNLRVCLSVQYSTNLCYYSSCDGRCCAYTPTEPNQEDNGLLFVRLTSHGLQVALKQDLQTHEIEDWSGPTRKGWPKITTCLGQQPGVSPVYLYKTARVREIFCLFFHTFFVFLLKLRRIMMTRNAQIDGVLP